MRQHDKLALVLLWHEMRSFLRSARKRDLAWALFGGAGLLAYGATDLVMALQAHAATLRADRALWTITLPVGCAVLGLLGGAGMTGLAKARAFAPFLDVQPLSLGERRRMVAYAAGWSGVVMALLVGILVGVACALVGKSEPMTCGLTAAALCAGGFIASLLLRLFIGLRAATERQRVRRAKPGGRRARPLLHHIDRSSPAWIGAWAWALPAGRLAPTIRGITAAVVFGGLALLAIAASLVRHQAAPAAMVGTFGGLALFMVSLRCRPLRSPVLRTAPVSFTRAWLRLIRLPILLSALFFTLPATTALAAQPSAWAMPLGGGLSLLVLNGSYAVFAAYFATAPFVAAVSFVAAVIYTQYESLEYGRTILLAFAALLALLWHRARRRYYRG